MVPRDLTAEQFRSYPPEACAFATAHLSVLQQMPTIYGATLLREVIDYDWKFPAERRAIAAQIAWLASLSAAHRTALFAEFAAIQLDRGLEQMDWVRDPPLFSERLTAWLWSSHQIDTFRAAATRFAGQLSTALPPELPPQPRLAIAVIGHGVARSSLPLFRKLRPHGVHFTQVDPSRGWQDLLEAVTARAAAHPAPYDHWYIDGGALSTEAPQAADSALATISYGALQPVRVRLLRRMQDVIHSGSGGPEMLERAMAAMTPQQVGLQDAGARGVLSRFELNLLTQGSGTQVFSTTFVQWAAREALRRAQPVTLLARFTPRQRQRPMNELLQGAAAEPEFDPEGSLVDADMGAYYLWLDQQRLSGAAESSFIVWFEDHSEALAVSPVLPRGTESQTPATLRQILQWIA